MHIFCLLIMLFSIVFICLSRPLANRSRMENAHKEKPSSCWSISSRKVAAELAQSAKISFSENFLALIVARWARPETLFTRLRIFQPYVNIH